MAKPNASRPIRPLVSLFAVLVALGVWTFWPNQGSTPRLGLDLRGGTQVTLTPRVSSGSITDTQLQQAVNIIRQRVNGIGVAEAEVSVQGQGNSASIVVSVPGVSEQGIADVLKQTALLAFRPVSAETGGAAITATPSVSVSQIGSPAASPSASASATPSATPTPTPSATPSASASPGNGLVAPIQSDANDAKLQQAFVDLNCTDPAARQGGVVDDPTKWIVTCSRDGAVKYLLEPAFIRGTNVTNATAQIPQNGTSWSVSLNFDSTGTAKLAEASQRLVNLPSPQNQFAIVLDGLVYSSPYFQSAILGGNAEITGQFTQAEAADLANVLKYGALPMTLDLAEITTLSPTLGQDQLNAGLLAGALGLVFVMLYLLFYYRALGGVAVISLVVAAAFTYVVFVVMGRQIGFTLTLAGVAGAIVAIGITADSFIVYFERIRDEIRDGKGLRTAVSAGWQRARRTILVADFISLLAAAVLYVLSIGGVRGFAFTLGLTTLIDIAIAFFFTHPTVELLARTKWFAAGSPLTGVDPKRLGVTSISAPHARSAYAEAMGE